MSGLTEQNPGIGLPLGSFTAPETTLLQRLGDIAWVNGDILYYGSNNFQRLPKGTDGNTLQLASGIPSWSSAGTGDFSSNTATSVDSEIVLFSSTGGKTGKRATGTGVAYLTSGVLSTSKVTLTQPATGSTLTIVDGKTLTVNNTITLAGTDAQTYTFPTTSATIARTDAANTFTGHQTIEGVTSTGATGTGKLVFDGTPTLVTPVLGVASATSLATSAASPLLLTNGQLVTIALTSQTTGATTLTIPDFASVVDEFVFKTKSVTMSNKTFVAPILGAATATSINGNTFTTGTYTLTGQAGKTLTFNGSITLTGTDAQTYTFPTTTATLARTDAGQTFTGVNVFTSPKIITQISDTNGNILVNIGATASAVNYVKLTNAITGTAGPIIAADGETNVDLKVAAKGTGKIHRTTGMYSDITAYSPAGAGTATLTLNTSNIHTITMPAGNITIALSNEGVGQCFVINILQDGTGSRTVTWFTTIKWAGGSAPTLTTTASKIDTFGFIVTSAGNYQGYIVGQNL